MQNQKILLFSSSRSGDSGYLETALPDIEKLLGQEKLKIAFIPFAAVAQDYDAYTNMVSNALIKLPYSIETTTPERAKAVLEDADVIMVGGGNTFKLLHDLYSLNLLSLIRDKVNKGIPYIGWSAGSNIAGATIGTSNDMPIIAPKHFEALGLIPVQINPHYMDVKPAGHHGETRDQRLNEFLLLHPEKYIVGLPEGTALKLESNTLEFVGTVSGYVFSYDRAGNRMLKKEINVNSNLNFLL